jgi:hypothetical protein
VNRVIRGGVFIGLAGNFEKGKLLRLMSER